MLKRIPLALLQEIIVIQQRPTTLDAASNLTMREVTVQLLTAMGVAGQSFSSQVEFAESAVSKAVIGLVAPLSTERQDVRQLALVSPSTLNDVNVTALITDEDYVNNNPSAFVDAYFDFQWLKIYG
ncbi:hypothetical protein C0993_008027 [Termitomyces sp. T159_Od127]|nr:hypothetical protein C0993_008027 [Termitomyces sp. T159_Od127]